ncbi:MAG: DUF5615 family PIN-like protein [Anaerolineae bacterium]|nr:DUF5615 family PIN-like protein [Anaerolineae bacterium]MDQ7035992.1 DUF5615 family PIN-like protein [Anaerolineae bacterium]
MKFLIDHNLSAKVADGLQELGHDAVPVSAYDMSRADDDIIFDRAAAEDRVIVSSDTDFGMLLAIRQSKKPSIILLRLFGTMQRASEQVALIDNNLPNIKVHLDAGCIVVIEPSRIRIRLLPIGSNVE